MLAWQGRALRRAAARQVDGSPGSQVAQLRLVAGEAEQAAADSAQALKAEARANQRDVALARHEVAASARRNQAR